MMLPGIEARSSRPLVNTLPTRPMSRLEKKKRTQVDKKRLAGHDIKVSKTLWFRLGSLFNGISTFVGYLIPSHPCKRKVVILWEEG